MVGDQNRAGGICLVELSFDVLLLKLRAYIQRLLIKDIILKVLFHLLITGVITVTVFEELHCDHALILGQLY
jgi:hypothetical protein